MELHEVPGIGDKTIATLQKAGIVSINDLLTTFPRTYRTYRATSTKDAQIGEWVVFKGTLSRPISKHTFRTTTQISTFWDLTGSLTLRWFNVPYIVRSVSPNSTYLIKGIVTQFNGKKQIIAPALTKIEEGIPLQDEIVPIYSATGGVKPWIIRQKIAQALASIQSQPDTLDRQIVSRFSLLPYDSAIRTIHHPPTDSDLEQAIHRFAFEELYSLQLTAIREKNSGLKKGPALKIDHSQIENLLNSLPFELTSSQQTAIQEIIHDLGQKVAMQRLLQGEVGSGKTIVAVASAVATHSAGFRTLVMAPTQILALQLFDNFTRLCSPLGIKTSLITAKSPGDITSDIIVGTQALLNRTLAENIGLVIVDEQHRFGVEQRSKLTTGQVTPHLLQMTATPIPRSYAQTIFRHLDITRLTDVPRNRLQTKTFVVPESKRTDSYTWIKDEIITNHNQVFIVVPLIEQAEENDTNPLKSLRELQVKLTGLFPQIELDVMHGKMKETEKVEHMTRFKEGITQILVATSMIEVGIDIPEANIIVIEDAERFGLAQLHQLRGRVGRGGKQGYCLLFTSSHSAKAKDRLSVFVRETNGEKLAKYDLEHRGPGELFGTLQSGFFNLSLGSMYDEQLLADTYLAAKITLGIDK